MSRYPEPGDFTLLSSHGRSLVTEHVQDTYLRIRYDSVNQQTQALGVNPSTGPMAHQFLSVISVFLVYTKIERKN